MLHTLRLYRKKDLDLITLYNCDRSFNRKMAKILCDYANGIRSIYSMEGVDFNRNTALDDNGIKYKNVYIHLSISKKNIAADSLLKKIRKGYKNDFIKCIMRSSLPYPISALYFEISNKFDMSKYEISTQMPASADNTIRDAVEASVNYNLDVLKALNDDKGNTNEEEKVYHREDEKMIMNNDTVNNGITGYINVNDLSNKEEQETEDDSVDNDATFYSLIDSLAEI